MDYGYARVSGVAQDLTTQLLALEQAGIAPSRIYQEKISGAAKKLPVRDQVLAQLRPGDTLHVHRLDRLGRSTLDVLTIIEDLDRRKVQFNSLTQPFDTREPTSRAFLQIMAILGEMERRLILERTADGRARRAEKGLHPGGPRMFGFTAKTLEPIPEEQALIREAARRVLDLEPMARVVGDWTDRGIRPVRGERWTVSSMRRLLLNPRVAQLVGDDQAQELIRLLHRPDRKSVGRPTDRLLSGILRCGRCGAPLYVNWKKARNGERDYHYKCKKGSGRYAGCGTIGVAMERADRHVEELFIAAIVSPEFAHALERRRAELIEGNAQDLDDWRAEIQDLDQVQGTRFYTETMQARHAELRRLVDRATERLMVEPDLQAMSDLPKVEEQVRALWASWSMATRRAWLRRIFEHITVMPATGKGRGSVVEDRLHPVWRL